MRCSTRGSCRAGSPGLVRATGVRRAARLVYSRDLRKLAPTVRPWVLVAVQAVPPASASKPPRHPPRCCSDGDITGSQEPSGGGGTGAHNRRLSPQPRVGISPFRHQAPPTSLCSGSRISRRWTERGRRRRDFAAKGRSTHRTTAKNWVIRAAGPGRSRTEAFGLCREPVRSPRCVRCRASRSLSGLPIALARGPEGCPRDLREGEKVQDK